MKFISKFDRYLTALYFITIIAIVAMSYFTFREAINSYNKNQHQSIVPLFSLATSEVIRPLNVANFMANDPLLIEFVEQENLDKESLLQYLKRFSTQYQMLTFIALEKHNLILDSNNKQISMSHEKAEWYHRLKIQENNQFADIGNSENPHLYFDMKLFNDQDMFIGFVGVAIDLNHFARQFKKYSQRFGYELIFVDQHNNVTLSSNELMKTESHHRHDAIVNINELSWYQQLLANESIYQPTETLVTVDSDQRIISQMPIQALNWRMFIISPPVNKQSEYWQLLLTRIGIFLVVIMLLFAAFFAIIDYFKKRLVADTEIDFLTKLPNRNYINWKFEEMNCQHKFICVVIADIDHFKTVNDKFGHNVGDDVLKEIANVLSKNLRRGDISSRWGGEEFVLLLPDASIEQTFDIIERIRKNIASRSFTDKSNQSTFNLSISFGIASNQGQKSQLNDLIEQADQALYQAKGNGRNRTEIFQ